jgi:GntR family transcriptional regulator, rspAB operon transcriptional repressor
VPIARSQSGSPPQAMRVMVARGRPNSSANVIYRALRADIVSMRRKPGEPISEKEIASVHGVSRTPVREALLRLADDQLVDIRPQSGTFVARIPIGALPETILVRMALEQLTARLAAERAGAGEVAGLYDIMEEQHRMASLGDRDRFHEADEAFHRAIAEAGGHGGIWLLVEQVKIQVDRYRRLTLPVPGRMSMVIDEHRAIVAAIEAHDAARAGCAMTAHLENLRASIGDVRDLNPEYFLDASSPEAGADRVDGPRTGGPQQVPR